MINTSVKNNNNNNKNKSRNDVKSGEYYNVLSAKLSTKLGFSKNLEKIEGELESIPKFHEHDLLLKRNYNIKQLKQIAKEYNLKLTGNKQQLVLTIFAYLYFSPFVIKVQKRIRGYLQRKYNKLHGPGYKNKKVCSKWT